MLLMASDLRHPAAPPDPARRALLHKRIRWFVAATITYNVIEAIIAISEGARVSSTALIGFGLDSVIEGVLGCRGRLAVLGADPDAREKITLRIIAISFFALAGYVTVESIRSLSGATEVRHSTIGIALTAASLIVHAAAVVGSTPRRP